MSRITKISGSQIFWMIFSLNIGMTILLTVRPAIVDAKQDAWISTMIGGLMVMGMTFIAVKLSLLYPNQTLIQFSQQILGSWLGKILMIPYFIMWYTAIGIVFRQTLDFLHAALFHITPLWLPIIIMAFVVFYAVYQGGIEGIGRCSEVTGPLILFTLCIALFLSIPNMDCHFVLPIYFDSGWPLILKGSLGPCAFLGESASMIMMLVPFIEKPKMALSRTLWGLGTAIFFLILSTLIVISTFGPSLSSKMWYPVFDVIRYISLMEFIQNIDVLVVVIWVLSVFIKLCLYVFITSYGTSQWLGIKNWRKTIWIVILVAVVFSVLLPNVDVSTIDYPKKYWIPYVIPINIVGMPLLLWIIGSIRKRPTVTQ